MKRATQQNGYVNGKHTISIHALVKRATASKYGYNGYDIISIHALVKRATRGAFFINGDENDFNPRPREEGDKITKILQLLEGISIHALVKRATVCVASLAKSTIISIHALVKRATL